MWVANMSQIFDGLVLPLKVKIRHPFGILQSNTQILQGLPERVLKVNPFAWALFFTINGFSEVFWDEK